MASFLAPDGYRLGKCLHDTPDRVAYLGVREDDGRGVVLKARRGNRGRRSDEARLRSEFEALQTAAGPGVPRALELILGHACPTLVLEHVPGISLSSWSDVHRPVELGAFLALAVQLSDVLVRLHARHLLHRDIRPHNVVVSSGGQTAHLIDFGLATPLGAAARAHDSGSRAEDLFDALLYIAPEQTGRLNPGCDFRSDLYSLGATLYHALTGRPPFSGDNALALIHAHMARVPCAPSELRPELPEAISSLLLRLLRKEPLERYQSARALRADLEACREQIARTGGIEAGFSLGRAETPDRPRFSARLHGREVETARLHAAYAQAADGVSRVLMIHGDAGIGKSALVDDLRVRLSETGGYLTVGKFDPYRHRPYAAFSALVESLVQQVLLESDARLERWRRELHAALGSIARPLVDLAPDLHFILGNLPPAPVLGPSETQARLSLALQRFVRACATPERPLAIFLDDLQWSDAASQVLLEDLICGSDGAALLLIGAYRSSEVGPDHALARLFDRLREGGHAPERIALGPLSRNAVLAMLAEALERPPETTLSLAEPIARKTANSPLLVRQFIEHLHARGLLRYQMNVGWVWSPAEIAAADIPDGAVALMTAKLGHLQAEPLAVLQLASCVGDEFDVEMLSELGRRERSALEAALYTLCETGLIVTCSRGFRFVHGRIREAAQTSLSPVERARLHGETGQLLLARIPEADWARRASEIVDHLNRGLDYLPEGLRLQVIQLNLLAGKGALAAGAAVTASSYLSVARALLAEDDWREHGALGVELHLQSIESAYQSAEYDTALALLDALEARTLSRMELAQAIAKRVRVLAIVKEAEECVQVMLSALRRLGVRWPLHPSRLRARLALEVVRCMVALWGRERLMQRATALDPQWLAPLVILGQGAGALLRHDLRLTVLALCLGMRRCLRSGYLTNPAYLFAVYTVWSCVLRGRGREALRQARIALDWNERIPEPASKPRTELVIHALIHPWVMRRRQALAPMLGVAETFRELGDPEFFFYARFQTIVLGALGGDPVAEAEPRLREMAEGAQVRTRLLEVVRCHRAYALLLERPCGAQLERGVAECQEQLAAQPRAIEPYTHTMWMLVLCVHGRHDLAFKQAEALGAGVFQVMPFVHVADHVFYRGLAAGVLAADGRFGERRRYRRELSASLRRLRTWARGGPDFVHMVSILEAERARLQGRSNRAREHYLCAAERATAQDFLHHAALAHERRAFLLGGLRREVEAENALAQAATLYEQWGARSRADALRAPDALASAAP
jgi:histidine kinase